MLKEKIKMNIEGMHCNSCKILILDILKNEKIKVKKFVNNSLEIESNIDFKDIKSMIEFAGYKVIKVD